jgi:hypothetical protein
VGTQSIGSIHLQPGSPDTVWVGTGEQGQSCWSYFGMGVFRSTDGGVTWEPRNGTPGASVDLSYVTAVATRPGDPSVVLAGGESWCTGGGWYYGGLHRSTDGGDTWSKVMSGAVGDVLWSPDDPNVAYAGVGRWGNAGDGVYRSTDAGVSWSRLENGVAFGAGVGRIRLAMAPSSSATLYALVVQSDGTRLYQTRDGGDSWTTRHADACEGQCWYDLCLAIDPADAASLLVGSIRFARSTDSGATLTYLTDTWGSTQKVHQDTHVLVYSAKDSKRFWVAGDGGVWRTDDDGQSFVNLNANLNITQFYDIAVHPDDRQTVFGGAQDNSSSRRAGSQLWDVTVVTGDGFVNLVDPGQPTTVFQTSYPWDGYPSVLRSVVGGGPNTFEWLWIGGLVQNEPYPWVTPLAIWDPGPDEGSVIFVASNHVYRADAAQSAGAFQWTKISPDLTGSAQSAVSVLAPVATGNGAVLYAGTANGRVWRCDNPLAPNPLWADVTGDYPSPTGSPTWPPTRPTP